MRKIIYIVAVTVLIAAFGFPHHPELSGRIIINVTGIDRVDGKWELTIMHKESSPTGGQQSEDKSVIKSGTGETLGEAAKLIETNLGRSLFFGHTRVIVFGKSVLTYGTERALEEYIENLSRHPLELAVGTEGKACDILETLSTAAENENIVDILLNAKDSGVNFAPVVLELQNHIDNDTAYIPCVKIAENNDKPSDNSNGDGGSGENGAVAGAGSAGAGGGGGGSGGSGGESGEGASSGKPGKSASVVFDGGMLVKSGGYVGKVSAESAIGFHMILAKCHGYKINVPYKDGVLYVELTDTKTSIRPYSGKFYVTFKAQARVGERSVTTDSLSERPKIEAAVADAVKKTIQTAVDDMLRNNTDAAYFAVVARHYGIWNGSIDNMSVAVKADINLREAR